MSQLVSITNASRSQKLMMHAKMVWRTLGPLICGSSNGHEVDNGHRENREFILEGASSMDALKFAFYVLTSDPKVLYAPNGTEADKIISKVSYILF